MPLPHSVPSPSRSLAPDSAASYRPLVSVVVPMFNAALTVQRALASIQAQTYGNWEAIFVDDASTDGGTDLIAAARDRRCRVIRLEVNVGPAKARNLGISAAQGELVAFLDADDEWLPEKLARQVAPFAADPKLALVVADMRVRTVSGGEGSSVYARQAPVSGGEAWRTLLASSFVATSAAVTRRDLLERLDGFDPGLVTGEDQDLFIRLALAGRVCALPETLAIYHWMPRSFSIGHARRQASDVLAMVHNHLRVLGPLLSARERRAVLARRHERLGANLLDAGALFAGAGLLLRAAFAGRAPVANLVRILRRLGRKAGSP